METIIIENPRAASRSASPFLQADSRRGPEIPDHQLHAAVIAANGSRNITREFEAQGFPYKFVTASMGSREMRSEPHGVGMPRFAIASCKYFSRSRIFRLARESLY